MNDYLFERRRWAGGGGRQRVALCKCIIFLTTPGTCGVIPQEEDSMVFWALDEKTFAMDGGCILSLFNPILQFRLLTSVTGYFLSAGHQCIEYTYTHRYSDLYPRYPYLSPHLVV